MNGQNTHVAQWDRRRIHPVCSLISSKLLRGLVHIKHHLVVGMECVSKKIAMGVTALAWEIFTLVPRSLLETTSGSASGSSNRQSWTIN